MKILQVMTGEFQEDNMKSAMRSIPPPKAVQYTNFIKYHCPLCSAELELIDDNYNGDDHYSYECDDCGYEWIES